MAEKPSDNPVVRALQLLTTGWGYNFYSDANRARADDLLVREKAESSLAAAVATFSAQEVDFRRQFIPAATRDQPFPPPEALERLRALGRLKRQISDVADRLRSAPVPTQDKVWFRLRREQALLYQLLACDQAMISGAQVVAELAREVTAARWNSEAIALTAPIEAALKALGDALYAREEMLLITTF